MKIAVMTDSTANLPKHIIEKYQIPVAPLSVTFDDGKHLLNIQIFQKNLL